MARWVPQGSARVRGSPAIHINLATGIDIPIAASLCLPGSLRYHREDHRVLAARLLDRVSKRLHRVLIYLSHCARTAVVGSTPLTRLQDARLDCCLSLHCLLLLGGLAKLSDCRVRHGRRDLRHVRFSSCVTVGAVLAKLLICAAASWDTSARCHIGCLCGSESCALEATKTSCDR